jgi:hypothetical protein
VHADAYYNICWSKQINPRSSITKYASAGELTAKEIATMTKHGRSKSGTATLLKHYMTVLFSPVLQVTSCFGNKDDKDYIVLQTLFNINAFCAQYGDGMEPVDSIFPYYRLWKDQQEADDGNDSNAANNLISMTLPFFAKVVLQDGVYWMEMFPNHPAVKLLLW